MTDQKPEGTSQRLTWRGVDATVELKPDALPHAGAPVAARPAVMPVISPDQLAARVTLKRTSRGRPQRVPAEGVRA